MAIDGASAEQCAFHFVGDERACQDRARSSAIKFGNVAFAVDGD